MRSATTNARRLVTARHDRPPSSPSASRAAQWGSTPLSAPTIRSATRCVLAAKAAAARDTIADLMQRGYDSAAIGRMLDYRDGSAIRHFMGGRSSAMLVERLAVVGQMMQLPRVAQAGCIAGYAVVAVPGGMQPEGFVQFCLRMWHVAVDTLAHHSL